MSSDCWCPLLIVQRKIAKYSTPATGKSSATHWLASPQIEILTRVVREPFLPLVISFVIGILLRSAIFQ
jgi:hypothetical protein